MKFTPYKDVVAMSKDTIKKLKAPFTVSKARKRAELEALKIDEEIVTLEAGINDECSKMDVDFNTIVKKMNALGLAERRKKQFQKIIDEMFPE